MPHKSNKFDREFSIAVQVFAFSLGYIAFIASAIGFARILGFSHESRGDYFSASVIATVAAGAITAATLVSLLLASKSLSDAEKTSSIAAALRADELHVEYNSSDMWRCRDLAWRYLTNIARDDAKIHVYARVWVLDDGDTPGVSGDRSPLPEKIFKDYDDMNGDEKREYSRYHRHRNKIDRSVSCIIAFYARLYNYVYSYEKNKILTDDDIAVIIGPFQWGYYRKCLMPLVNKCDEIYNTFKANSYDRPYFIDQLRALDVLYERSILKIDK